MHLSLTQLTMVHMMKQRALTGLMIPSKLLPHEICQNMKADEQVETVEHALCASSERLEILF